MRVVAHRTLSIFIISTLMGDDAHRIHKCDECNGYIRTVFIEDALRPFSYEVEEVVTAKLDAIARDPKFQTQE